MKVAVTGHTSGIGQGLYQYFEAQGHEVLGFSTHNGYALPEAEDRVLEQIQHCDIFVNNALPIASQISLLKKLWPIWENANKKIIVIGSIASRFQFAAKPGMEDYQREKKELDDVCNTLRYVDPEMIQGKPCSLITIHPGFVDTNIFGPDSPIAKPPKAVILSVAQVVDVVNHILTSPIKIDDIVFRRT